MARGDGRSPSLWFRGGGCRLVLRHWQDGRTGADSASSVAHPKGPSPRDTASVVVVALALFREELRKHPYFLNTFSFEDAPQPSPTERSHASALLAEHLLWLVVVAFFLRGVTQAPLLLPEHLLF